MKYTTAITEFSGIHMHNQKEIRLFWSLKPIIELMSYVLKLADCKPLYSVSIFIKSIEAFQILNDVHLSAMYV